MCGKTGTITSVNLNDLTARVNFDDSDETVSDELQYLSIDWIPTVGQFVFCSFTHEKKGFIIGPIAE